jgi:hypothetical protein
MILPRQLLIAMSAGMISLFGCSKNPTTPSTPVTPPPTTPVVTDNRFPVNLIIDSATLAYIRTEAASNTEMANAITSIILNPANSALSNPVTPYIQGNSSNFSDISAQARNCKSLAVRWLYTYEKSPAEAKPYFDKVVSTLLAWVNGGNKIASPVHTPNESSYFGFYEAYSVVRSRMTAADRTKVDNWITARSNAYQIYPARVNNWETIRLCLLYFFGYILNNKSVINLADNAYNTLLNVNLMEGGKSEDLINRDAFSYHAYNLAFYARILRIKSFYEGTSVMTSLKNKKNNINVSVQDMVNYWRPFLVDPANNVHIEFVNTKYDPDKSRSDYNKPYVPASSVYALEELLLAFPEVAGYIQTINGATRYTSRLSGFLYWPK